MNNFKNCNIIFVCNNDFKNKTSIEKDIKNIKPEDFLIPKRRIYNANLIIYTDFNNNHHFLKSSFNSTQEIDNSKERFFLDKLS